MRIATFDLNRVPKRRLVKALADCCAFGFDHVLSGVLLAGFSGMVILNPAMDSRASP